MCIMTTGSTLWWEIRMTLGWLVVGGGAGPGGGTPSVEDSTVVEVGARDEACPGPEGGASALEVGGGRVPFPVMVTVVPTLIWRRQMNKTEVSKIRTRATSTPRYTSKSPSLCMSKIPSPSHYHQTQ